MYKITISGEAKTDHYDINDIDGISCQDEFSEYFNEDESSLIGIVTNGYMRFEVIDNILMTITEYHSIRELTLEEVEILEEYTTGQWSDGIGEGFEQEPCLFINEGRDEVYVSPWYFGQEVTTKQELL